MVVASMLMRHLDSKRAQICFVTAAAGGFTKTRLDGDFDVHFCGPRFTYASEARIKKALARVRHDGTRHMLNRLASYAGNLLNLGYVWRLLSLARSRRVQVVHCNNSVNLEAVMVALILRLPCVFHVHGLGVPDRIVNLVVTRVRRRFIAVSRAIRNNLVSNGVPANDISLIENPVERPQLPAVAQATLRMQERSALALGDDDIAVGIVGRVVEWKGQAEFLRACRIAFESCPTMHAIIVGDASDLGDAYYANLRASIAASEFSHRVHFRGFVDDPDRIYAALDILVHSSIEPEPFGLVITEAMVRGLPVVVANTGAPPELVEHGVTGFVEDPLDEASVAARLVELAHDRALRKSMGARAREAVLVRHDPTVYADHVVEVYASLARPE